MSGPVVVVGGGITGLVAAHRLATAPERPDRVTIVEASPRLGGRVLTTEIEGLRVDEAADAFLLRVPWALDLCRELGLERELIHPATSSAFVVRGGRLRPFPSAQLLGVPTSLLALVRSGAVGPLGSARAAVDLLRGRPLAAGTDDAVGAVVRRRLGAGVADRLVGPLVGGINAGDPDRLSIRAVTPQLAEAAADRSLMRGARRLRRRGDPAGGPVFAGLRSGTGRLVEVLVDRLERAGVDLRTGVTADAVGRGRVTTTAGDLEADATILATPAPRTALLLGEGPSSELLASIPVVSVVLVTLVFDRADVGASLAGSGMLLPRAEGRRVTACSFGSTKWPHWRPDSGVLLRASVGRDGDDVTPRLGDDDLLDVVLADLADLLDLRGPPRSVRISRWPDSFPQYRPGHLDRLGRLRQSLAADHPGVLVAGASYEGVGLPACIRQGADAAAEALATSRAR